MVDALRESWRVLRQGGILVDLRPYASGWPLEVISHGDVLLSLILDDSLRSQDDIESNRAISSSIEHGWFKKQSEQFFDYAYYWDRLEDMSEYMQREWWNLAVIPEGFFKNVQRVFSSTSGSSELRIRRSMLVATYCKIGI
jgi:hypothetical protein